MKRWCSSNLKPKNVILKHFEVGWSVGWRIANLEISKLGAVWEIKTCVLTHSYNTSRLVLVSNIVTFGLTVRRQQEVNL